jgi:starch synthase
MTQLYGLRYGCVPVAAHTGGLADTIIDANEAALAAGVATGFLFDSSPYEPTDAIVDPNEAGVAPEPLPDNTMRDGLTRALRRAVTVFGDRKAWRSIQKQGMKADFSWRRSGQHYADLYKRLVKAP